MSSKRRLTKSSEKSYVLQGYTRMAKRETRSVEVLCSLEREGSNPFIRTKIGL